MGYNMIRVKAKEEILVSVDLTGESVTYSISARDNIVIIELDQEADTFCRIVYKMMVDAEYVETEQLYMNDRCIFMLNDGELTLYPGTSMYTADDDIIVVAEEQYDDIIVKVNVEIDTNETTPKRIYINGRKNKQLQSD